MFTIIDVIWHNTVNSFTCLYFPMLVVLPTTTTTTTTADPNDPCGPSKPISLDNYGGGYIISPNYPDNYPDEADCQWNMLLKANQTLIFELLDFDLEYR